ncbi:flagellar basal body rod protein FlgC [Leifsonia sp. Leaf264]|uniref:flagellar basal body rod protein FlgC n=1 Tax=Leifsonia sp. Leaf264 TaxID=1736314 RepID=UPI0006F83342|nr:flagellar basal body rod C-terminal domain-containing protein [Leifsonia sp. Leaf264]KQO98230.1 flagellar basal-body rod protein FlgC [Leifsonia sp. Leaf264]
MTAFDSIGISGTGLTVNRKWLDAIADNIANINTAAPTDGNAFQARYIEVQAGENGDGVYVKATRFGDAEGRLAYEPDNPLADENGYVRYPDIDLSSQMSQLIMAQRAYQANAAAIDRSQSIAQAGIKIGHA